MDYITIEELLNNIGDFTIIDVRSSMDFKSGHIENAINIPLMQLSVEADELEKAKKIVVYCNSGKSSTGATLLLKDMGFNVKNLKGGYNEYKMYCK